MHWNYRLIKNNKGYYEVHEVYYSENNEPFGISENSTFIGESKEDIIKELEMIINDLEKINEIGIDEIEERIKNNPLNLDNLELDGDHEPFDLEDLEKELIDLEDLEKEEKDNHV